MKFKLHSDYVPNENQNNATDFLSMGIEDGIKDQVMLGVTGSGKTYTIAQIIEKTQRPALLISHNKTLAGQLYQEMKDFFPENAVSYFVSYYDYYQPEAYIAATDTYIEKEATINDQIDKLRLRATADLLTRDDVIVVASVSCIYNIGSPKEYGNFVIEVTKGKKITTHTLMKQLISLQYERSEFDFKRGSFRLRGDHIDVYPAYDDYGLRIVLEHDTIKEIAIFDPVSGAQREHIQTTLLYPSKHYMVAPESITTAEEVIRADLKRESKALLDKGKFVESERLIRRVNYDLEMLKEMGYVNGVENYSRYFDGRKPGDSPYSLLNYFNYRFGDCWTTFIDESHMTIPQVRGMYNGDQARKKTLVDYGFRLEASYDNRPLYFDEFYKEMKNAVYVSATPAAWELEQAKSRIVELLVRPTGIVDPQISVRPTENEIPDLISEIKGRVEKKERILVTTLTKKTAEDLAHYLQEAKIKAEYLHSDIKTLKRSTILQKLRKQEYDVLIGVNLLREGLDLPEVTLVAILDADKEGFLRSRTSLIQTMGRAARNIDGEVILYADKVTGAMKEAIEEVGRRRQYQLLYNAKYGITPTTIIKKIRDQIAEEIEDPKEVMDANLAQLKKNLKNLNKDSMTSYDRRKLVKKLEMQLRHYVEDMNFEAAILVRDKVRALELA